MTLVQSEPKKIYIRVDEQATEFEFNFTDSTWWYLNNANIANNKFTWWYWYYDTWIDIKDANKITIDATVYGTTWSWVGLIYLTFYPATWWGPDTDTWQHVWMIINYMTNSWYDQSGVKVAQDQNYTHNMYTVTSTKYGNGTEMPVHCEIDIANKTVSFSMNNTLIGTQTISDADINAFRSTSLSKFWISLSHPNWYVSYLKIKIDGWQTISQLNSLNNLSNTFTPTIIPDTPNNWTWDVLTI